MTMQLHLGDGPVDVTHSWLHDSFVAAIEAGDHDQIRTLAAVGLIAFGERESVETQLGAARTVQLHTHWTPDRLAVLEQLISALELHLAGLPS